MAVLVVLGVLGVILATWVTARPGRHARKGREAAATTQRAQRGLPAAEAGLLPWHLAAPLSREVIASSGGRLIVLGGLEASGASTPGVYAIRTATGRVHYLGALKAPVHDAGVAVIAGRALVFGGGSTASITTVQAFSLFGRSGGNPAADVGSMPVPRSDTDAVTIGPTAYVVGGYDGAHPDAAVLATTNGRTFRTVAALRVPVRYPAVATLGGLIYVFGGQAVTGSHAGAPVDVIQSIDPARHTAEIIGHLPEPLMGAMAMAMDNELFVAGGDSSETRRPSTVSTIWALDPAAKRLLFAGRLQVPVSHAGVAVIGSAAWIVGGESGGAPTTAVQMLRPNRDFGIAGAPGAGSPFFGARLLVADRGNSRLLLMNDAMHVVWRYPSPTDDAFFIDHGTAILSDQKQNETIVKIGYPSGKVLWSYGHPRRAGSARGFLHEPDDAYLLRNGQVTVADARNCRVLVLNRNGTVAHQIGADGICVHRPPTAMGSPNGDTPLADGDLLISEVNGSWVSEYTPGGKLIWTVKLPIGYPSDPEQIGPDRYLIADSAVPGQIVEFNRKGRVLYRYHPASGQGRLDHPSLAELLPSGVIMVNDDHNDRVIAIDPVTKALVWQYGVTRNPGRGPGRLNTPDGFDLLLPNGTTPTHRATG